MLTMLGIIIGVAAVITMIAVGGGAQQRVEEQIKSLGTNIMLVLPGARHRRRRAARRADRPEPDRGGRARPSRSRCPKCRRPRASLRTGAQVVAGNTNWSTSVLGTTTDYLEARDWPLAAGRNFEAADMAGSAKVAIIGQTVARAAVRRCRPDRPDDPRAQGAAAR